MTETAEQIGQVVTYARYFPLGQRGISTMRPHSLYHPGKLEDYMPAANRRISIFAQIESRKGLKEAETILQTKGVDGLFIGPNDLSCDLGFPPDAKQKICGEILRLGQCASDCGKACGIITSDPTYLKQAKQAGLSHFCVGSELSMLKSAALATVQEIEVD